MRFISNNGVTDPRINLALEEYCLRNLDMRGGYFLLYVNGPSVIVGRNQNPILEINRPYLRKKNVRVVRRVSGGGAVYQDLGNLNFSFLTRYDRHYFHNFRHFTEPVLAALNRLGVPAELDGRNNIVASGLKVSGHAQYATGKTMLSHGTLLLNSDLEALEQSLQPEKADIRSKALQSIRSRVANLSDFLSSPMDMEDFRSLILETLFQPFGGVREYRLSKEDWTRVLGLSRKKYSSWNWTYGRSPKFRLERSRRFKFGSVQARITVEKGIIRGITITADALSSKEKAALENRLINIRYSAKAISECLTDRDLKNLFGSIGPKAFADFLSPFQ